MEGLVILKYKASSDSNVIEMLSALDDFRIEKITEIINKIGNSGDTIYWMTSIDQSL